MKGENLLLGLEEEGLSDFGTRGRLEGYSCLLGGVVGHVLSSSVCAGQRCCKCGRALQEFCSI